MNEATAYLITAQVTEIAQALWKSAVIDMTEEEFAASAPPLNDFLPKAVEIFIKRHAEIQRLISARAGA